MNKFKDYPSQNRKLWARLQALQPAPEKYEDRTVPEGCGALFWGVVCALIWAVAIGLYLWTHTEPIQQIFPAIYG